MEGTYLGDGAYVKWNGYAYILYTSNGVTRTNEIYLEPSAMRYLQRFVTDISLKAPLGKSGISGT